MTSAVTTPELHEGICSREGCPANDGGACLEGHENKIDCRYFDLKEATGLAPGGPTIQQVPLPDGEALEVGDLERATRSYPVSMVAPLGRVGAGKTTLFAVTYHLLRSGRLSRWRFSRSETIIGFARRAHDASFASRRELPSTPRTQREESGLHLHIDMREVNSGDRHPLVLVDLSGEHVEEMTNGQRVEVVENAIHRAHHIPIVVDGRKIRDARPRAVMDARALLKMLEKHEPADSAKVSLVITKGDLLVGRDLCDTVDAITQGTLAEGRTWVVTADRASAELGEDGEPRVPLGEGIDRLVELIADRPPDPPLSGPPETRPSPSPMLQRMWGLI